MSATLSLHPLVFVREHDHGACYAFPVGCPGLRARGDTEAEAVEGVGKYLAGYLSDCPAENIADFIFPEDAYLLDVAAPLPRADLPRRLQPGKSITIPCLVVPDGKAHWVAILPLEHTVHVAAGEELERRVLDEIRRAAAARDMSGDDFVAVLPTVRHKVLRIEIEVERDDASDLSRRAASRRRKDNEQLRKASRELLESIGTSMLAASAKKVSHPPVIGRDREIRALASLLSSQERLSVMLVGSPLSGKSAVISGLLSQSLVRFTSHPVYATSGAQLVAGQSGFGQLQQRVDEVMAAAERLDAVLYFDDYGDLFAGHSGSIEDIAAMMRPWIADGRVRVVGELSTEALEHYEKRHVAFFSAMHRITVDDLSAETTKEILGARALHQKRHEPRRPWLRSTCVEPLVELSQRYLSYQAFPGKAVVLADELRAVHEGEVTEKGEPRPIEVADVYRAFSVRSGIPMFLLREEQAMRYTEVLEFFARRIIGQRPAIEAVAQTLCSVKAGLQPPAKPLINLLFLGPTGVGKTEVAKTLARFLFGGEDKLVRFDMSEYADPFASERLIRGTQREEGELTRRVRQQPFCVVLLDEIEKAHPAVFDLLLAVLGEGRLSDARGRVTSFVNCIVIMTSNLGASHVRPRSGFGTAGRSADEDQRYVEEVERHFRPEFVNRLDRVIPFSSLSPEEIAQVAQVALRGLLAREGIAGRGIVLTLSERAVASLAIGGHSETYGARALRRHLEDVVVAPVARLLSAAGVDGDGSVVRVVLEGAEEFDAAGPVEGAPLGHTTSQGLAVGLFRGSVRARRSSGPALHRIAVLRRTAAAVRHLEIVDEMHDRRTYLVAELARGGKRGRALPGRLVAEHARISELLTALDDAVEALEGVEDLASAAVYEGEDPTPYVEEGEDAMATFEEAFVRAVMGQYGADAAVLMVAAHTDPERLTMWLLDLLHGAEARGWDVVVHRWEDAEKESGWPDPLQWGPPRTPSWVREALQDAEPEAIRRAWRGALVCVSGPGAGGLMCFEAGIHRFVVEGEGPEHIEVRVKALTKSIDSGRLGSEKLALGKPESADVLGRTTAAREYDPGRKIVGAPLAGQVFDVDPSEYWRNHPRIMFSILADRLSRGEDPVPSVAGTMETKDD